MKTAVVGKMCAFARRLAKVTTSAARDNEERKKWTHYYDV
jgi:hypothetical protein